MRTGGAHTGGEPASGHGRLWRTRAAIVSVCVCVCVCGFIIASRRMGTVGVLHMCGGGGATHTHSLVPKVTILHTVASVRPRLLAARCSTSTSGNRASDSEIFQFQYYTDAHMHTHTQWFSLSDTYVGRKCGWPVWEWADWVSGRVCVLECERPTEEFRFGRNMRRDYLCMLYGYGEAV